MKTYEVECLEVITKRTTVEVSAPSEELAREEVLAIKCTEPLSINLSYDDWDCVTNVGEVQRVD
jgi:hypothetical protein|tara:strand:+ start:158 stop:349 length:192 start_codon:yes stop_codon:yes gene_type:complete